MDLCIIECPQPSAWESSARSSRAQATRSLRQGIPRRALDRITVPEAEPRKSGRRIRRPANGVDESRRASKSRTPRLRSTLTQRRRTAVERATPNTRRGLSELVGSAHLGDDPPAGSAQDMRRIIGPQCRSGTATSRGLDLGKADVRSSTPLGHRATGRHGPRVIRHAMWVRRQRTRREMPTWTDAFRGFIELADCARRAGHGERRDGQQQPAQMLDPQELRGLALADDLAPLVFTTARTQGRLDDSRWRHELAHIWLGQYRGVRRTGVSVPEHQAARWCNRVAGLLVLAGALASCDGRAR